MAITIDESRDQLTRFGLVRDNYTNSGTLYLNLYGTAAHTPTAAWVAGSIVTIGTVNYSGGEKGIHGTSWGVSHSNGTSTFTCSGTFGTQAFTFVGSVGNVYGYCITTGNISGTTVTGSIVAAENFSSPQMVSGSGDIIRVIPTIKLV